MEKICEVQSLSHGKSSEGLAVEDHKEFGQCSAISEENLVAFTSPVGLLKADQKQKPKTKLWHIYATDLNIPWEPFRVASSPSEISLLEWGSNTRLLAADKSGKIKIFGLKNSSLNEWTELCVVDSANDRILTAGFFHTGKQMSLLFDQKGSTRYTDKYVNKHMSPTKRKFGGSPQDGIFVVTDSSLMSVHCFDQDGKKHPESLTLGNVRQKLAHASVAYGKGGEILVCANPAEASQSVRCYKVSLVSQKSAVSTIVQAVCENFGTFRVISDGREVQIQSVQFSHKDDPKSILVLCRMEGETMLQLFDVREKTATANSFFTKNLQSHPDSLFRTTEWICEYQWRSSEKVLSVAAPKFSFVSGANGPMMFVVLATERGRLVCLNKENMKEISQTFVNHSEFDSPHKKMKLESEEAYPRRREGTNIITTCCHTPLSSVLVTFDATGTLTMYRLSPILEPGGPLNVPNAVLMLEYCLLSGIDHWEILTCLRAGMVDSVCEKLWESFNAQPQHIHQFHYAKLVAMMISLYRMAPGFSHKAVHYSILQTLNHIHSALRSFLRPSELTSQERGPAENLASILHSKVNEYGTEIDKVLPFVDVKEFTVDANTLATLQPIIQWVGNTALRLLSSVPEGKQRGKGAMVDVLKDVKVINMFRELLVLIRIWGVFRPVCLPVFCRNDAQDVLAKLFQLLTRLVLNTEVDEAFVDECCQLQSQHLVPGIPLSSAAVGIASPLLFQTNGHIQIHFGESPPETPSVSVESIVENFSWLEPPQSVDCVRQIYLGKVLPSTKQCSRCVGSTLLNGWARSAAIRSWEMRWTNRCPCGGMWVVQKPGCLIASG